MFILINKPKKWTSHDVAAYIRSYLYKLDKKYKKIKVGHSGTLDPFATGLLIIGIGRESTKKLDEFKNLPKTYLATFKLGYISDTFDSTGKIEKYKPKKIQIIKKIFLSLFNKKKEINLNKINLILNKFLGKQKQTPPMYSAKKIKGKRLYKLARQGIKIKRKPVKITIHNLNLIEYNQKKHILIIKTTVSSGTYIRSLAYDIGKKLGCGAYCQELERTKIGNYSIKNSTAIKKIHTLLNTSVLEQNNL